jgi:drug/metabolite transporter (DMT)-like permease
LIFGMASGALSDATVKAVSAHLPTGEVLFLRGMFSSVCLLLLVALVQRARWRLRDIANPMVLLRTVGECAASAFYLLALAKIPLANASAILLALPLAVTIGAATFLRESVGWRRWLATVIGFSGVIIVIRPGFEGFSLYAVAVVVSVVFAATRDLATRRLPSGISTLFVIAVAAPAVTLTGGAIAIASGEWHPPSAGDYAFLAASGVLLIGTYQFIGMSMRVGEVSFVVPFRYTRLLWAIAIGALAFLEIPDAATMIGSAVIIGSGLYTLHRERKVLKSARAIPPAPE